MSKKMDTKNQQEMEEEYKDTAVIFKDSEKVTSASDEMLDLNRVAYKAG